MTATQEIYGLVGRQLPLPEATNIKISLLALSRQKGVTVTLWGKVEGYHGDYHVAQAPSKNFFDLQGRETFYSIDGGVNWIPLPPRGAMSEEQVDFCDQIRGPFMGQPAYEYKVQKQLPVEEPPAAVAPEVADVPADELEDADKEDDEKEPEEGDAAAAGDGGDEEEEGDKKPAVKRPKFRVLAMAETFRLVHFVAAHDANCAIAPRGAFLLKDEAGTVVPNAAFAGHNEVQAMSLHQYFHLRPASREAAQAIFGETYNKSWDFLEPISNDRPQGVWSVKVDHTSGVAVLQNLWFQGAVFWHRLGTNEFGSFYFGTGERNVDLCFILPVGALA